LWNLRLGSIYSKLLPTAVRKRIRGGLNSSFLPAGVATKLRHSFLYRSQSLESMYFSNFLSTFTPEEVSVLLGTNGDPSHRSAHPYGTALAYSAQAGTSDLLAQLLYTDIRTYLVELLMKQDNMSMATSVESRVPFLDHKLVETVCAMPSTLKIRGFQTKYLLRKAMENILPPSILKQKKRGFPTPLPPWMRQHLPTIRSILLDQKLAQRQVVRTEAIRSLFDFHESGKRNCTFQIWRLLNFELWCRVFFDRDGSESEIEPSAEVATA
jgi:asparagine synthase (glutamine-hydrolysing)